MISVRTEGLDEAIKALDPKQVEKAHVRATNHALGKGRTAWSKQIRQDYAIKAGDVKKSSSLRKIKSASARAGVELSGPVLPLKAFGPRQTRRGISVKIRKDGPRRIVRGGFSIPSAPGHVFKRRGDDRLPIEKLFTVSIPQMADDSSVINSTVQAIENAYTTEYARLVRLFGEQI